MSNFGISNFGISNAPVAGLVVGFIFGAVAASAMILVLDVVLVGCSREILIGLAARRARPSLFIEAVAERGTLSSPGLLLNPI
jgi:hypothetical protein